jgi:hypothetical protein
VRSKIQKLRTSDKNGSLSNPERNVMDINKTYRIVRILLAFFMFGLVISGLTAFPLILEVNLLEKIVGNGSWVENIWPDVAHWISYVHQGLNEVNTKYPFMFYGTDWLAFAHITIAISFLGPLRDPVKNVWGVEFGMIACVLIIPLALICGPIRGIPFFWTLIDCSFGVFGIIPLAIAYRLIKRIILMEPPNKIAK